LVLKNLKFHILVNLIDQPWGGGNQFLKSLRLFFRGNDFYCETPDSADCILFNSYPFGEELKTVRGLRRIQKQNPNAIFLHRVDGPISRVRGVPNDQCLDQVIVNLNDHFATGTVFQSNWSRERCFEFGFDQTKPFETILNAPDNSIFFPAESTLSSQKTKIIATSWSNNWRKGFDVYKYLDQNLDFNRYEFSFVGNSPIKFKNIRHLSPLKSKDLGDELRKHHAFITASIDDPCSNSLIEAIHCGLIPLARSSGGHPQIVGQNGLLFEGTRDILEKIEDIGQKISKSFFSHELPSIKQVGEMYLEFASKVFLERKNSNSTLLKTYYFGLARNLFYCRYGSLIENKLLSPFPNRFHREIRNCVFPEIKKIKREFLEFDSKEAIQEVTCGIPKFLGKLRHPQNPKLYKLTLSGDLQKEPSLASSVFAAKIHTMLGSVFNSEELVAHIKSFQIANGTIFDPWIHKKSFLNRWYYSLRNRDFNNAMGMQNKRAETRQSFAALRCLGRMPEKVYQPIIKNKKECINYIHKLDWSKPWNAASHVSHLFFFLQANDLITKDFSTSSSKITNELFTIINENYRLKDGSWGRNESVPESQRINGSMKMVTAFEAAGITDLENPESLIDLCLKATNDQQACDHFNIICVLHYCSRITNYRKDEIVEFALNRLRMYEKHYWPEVGGFSFHQNRSQDNFYGAKVSCGYPEPDIHGTIMLLWGVVLICEILGWRSELNLRLPIT
jgi:glycosyltransferase involved in cell wall biosynthesis